MIDGLAFEPQFLDHLAPVWRALPDRGKLLIETGLMDRAARLGLEAEPVNFVELRASQPLPPTARMEDGPIAFATSIGDIKVGRRLGYRRFVFMEHGAGQAYIGERGYSARHQSYSGGIDREDVELFLVPNEYSADLWRTAYPAATVQIVGCPKLDTLPARQLDPNESGPIVAISFHWPGHVSPESDTALGYYLRALPELAKRYSVIGHAHPKGDWPQRLQRDYRRAGIPFVADFDDVCRKADLFIADNTSCLFEFASTGRPVVVLNSPGYRKDVHHGLRFWAAADVGIQVDHASELLPAVERALLDREEQQERREAALDIVYQPRSGGTALAAAAITEWLAARQAVAA